MGSEYSWHIETRVIYAHLFENVTQDDLRKGNIAIMHLINTTGIPPIHVIFDTANVSRVMITALQARNELQYLQDARTGWLVICGLRGLVEAAVHFIGGVVSRTTNIQVHTVPTFDDAINFLAGIDPTLKTTK